MFHGFRVGTSMVRGGYMKRRRRQRFIDAPFIGADDSVN